jgi:catechol 2,3-dioxygenase-like lactoylglutathione lyase family enzyme
MIKGLAHVCFRVTDLDRSIDFYRNKLGLTPAFDFRRDNGERFGLYFHVGERTFIELFVGEPQPRDTQQSYQHFCLEVDDLKKTIAQLQAQGVEVTGEKLGNDHSWQAWIEDPDGNRIELHQYTPESWQAPWADGQKV